MSIESAKAYMSRLKRDEEFRNRIKRTPDRGIRLDFIKAEGFDWDEGDFKAALAEMSDEELQAVGGDECRMDSGYLNAG